MKIEMTCDAKFFVQREDMKPSSITTVIVDVIMQVPPEKKRKLEKSADEEDIETPGIRSRLTQWIGDSG